MCLDAGHDADAFAFAVQREREFQPFGRGRVVVGKLHIDVDGPAVLLLLKQTRKVCRAAGRYAADKNQPVLFTARAQIQAAAPAHAVKTGVLEGAQLFIERPRMLQERPEIRDVTENGFAPGFFHRLFVGDEVASLKLKILETPYAVSCKLGSALILCTAICPQ